MNVSSRWRWAVLLLAACAVGPGSAWAAMVYRISLDTSSLSAHPAAPFSVDFQLTDGEGIGNGNTSVLLSDFDFGVGGSAVGSPVLLGGASGKVSTTVAMVDTSFVTSFADEFVPGDRFAFTMSLAADFAPQAFPDLFAFAILDSSGFEIPYDGLLSAALTLNLSLPLVFETFGTDATVNPFGGGPPIAMAAPSVTPIPEPSTLSLISLALGWLVWRRRLG